MWLFSAGLFVGMLLGGIIGAWNGIRAFKNALKRAEKP